MAGALIHFDAPSGPVRIVGDGDVRSNGDGVATQKVAVGSGAGHRPGARPAWSAARPRRRSCCRSPATSASSAAARAAATATSATFSTRPAAPATGELADGLRLPLRPLARRAAPGARRALPARGGGPGAGGAPGAQEPEPQRGHPARRPARRQAAADPRPAGPFGAGPEPGRGRRPPAVAFARLGGRRRRPAAAAAWRPGSTSRSTATAAGRAGASRDRDTVELALERARGRDPLLAKQDAAAALDPYDATESPWGMFVNGRPFLRRRAAAGRRSRLRLRHRRPDRRHRLPGLERVRGRRGPRLGVDRSSELADGGGDRHRRLARSTSTAPGTASSGTSRRWSATAATTTASSG